MTAETSTLPVHPTRIRWLGQFMRDTNRRFVVQKSNTQNLDDIVTIVMIADSRRLFEVLGATALAALVLATLLPASWVPRTGFGWEDDHFLMYFATTTLLCIASRRPFIVAVSLIICAGVLEAVQGLTPDRFPDFRSALAGAVGVISAATLVALVTAAIRKVRNMTPALTPTNAPIGIER